MECTYVLPVMKLTQFCQQSVWLLVSFSGGNPLYTITYGCTVVAAAPPHVPRYYHEPNEMNSLVSSEHNGTNMIYGRSMLMISHVIYI